MELLDKMNQFDVQYESLRKFVEESSGLLERERPVGESAARIEEQMKTCQVRHSQLVGNETLAVVVCMEHSFVSLHLPYLLEYELQLQH